MFFKEISAPPQFPRRNCKKLHLRLVSLLRAAFGRASHGDTKTRRKVPARNADVLVGIIASLRFQVSGFRSQVSGFRFQHFPSPFMYAGFKRIAPDQVTCMVLYEPWVTALGLFNAGE